MNLGVLLFGSIELLDVFGPLEILSRIEDVSIELVSDKGGTIDAAQCPAATSQAALWYNRLSWVCVQAKC